MTDMETLIMDALAGKVLSAAQLMRACGIGYHDRTDEWEATVRAMCADGRLKAGYYEAAAVRVPVFRRATSTYFA